MELEWHVYQHGRPADKEFWLHQYYDTLGFPNWQYNHGTINKNYKYPTNKEFQVMVFKDETGEWKPSIKIKSHNSRAKVHVKGKNAGTIIITVTIISVKLDVDEIFFCRSC